MNKARLTDIENCRSAIAPFLHRTPLVRSSWISRLVGADVYLKLEPFQKTGSFKVRGMLAKLSRLNSEERARGVVTFSAGNAAQGLAYAAACFGAKATVVMPENASISKIEAARGYGAEILLVPDQNALLGTADEIVQSTGAILVHPYDDLNLMIGHASLGLELLEDLPDADLVVTAIGGGGMAGALAMVNQGVANPPRLVGVEPVAANHMATSLKAGRATSFAGRSIAEGLCPPGAGQLCFEMCKASFEQIILIDDRQIVDAMHLLLQRLKIVAEPSGAAALAGLLSGQLAMEENAKVAVIVSGGNIDLPYLATLLN